jgi:hypothetical protein
MNIFVLQNTLKNIHSRFLIIIFIKKSKLWFTDHIAVLNDLLYRYEENTN